MCSHVDGLSKSEGEVPGENMWEEWHQESKGQVLLVAEFINMAKIPLLVN